MAEHPTLKARPGFRWELVNWGGPDEARTEHCSYCGDKLPGFESDFVPLILSRSDGWVAEFCDHCQAAWFGLETFSDDPANDDEPANYGFEDYGVDEPSDTPNLGPCCMCEATTGVRNLIMLDRRCVIAGHGWGCLVCGLPSDGASAVLCDDCLTLYRADNAWLTIACRGYPGEDGRVAIAELPPEPFEHDMAKHAGEGGDG
jgi:hypothetical protein